MKSYNIVNVLIALNTRMQLPMCNIANVLLLMLMLLKRVIWIFDILDMCIRVPCGGNKILYHTYLVVEKGYRIFWDYKVEIAVRFQSTVVILLGLRNGAVDFSISKFVGLIYIEKLDESMNSMGFQL